MLSPAQKRAQLKYRSSEKGIATRNNYEKSKKGRELASRRRNKPAAKIYMKKYMQKYQRDPENIKNKRRWTFSWEGKAFQLLQGMRESTRRKNLGKIEWTSSEILEKIKDKRCCKTGIDFTLQDENTPPHTRNPFAPSPDRIDNNKGYTKKNVQWVCWMYNQMKGQATEKEIKKFLTAINNFTGEKI
jgi:hypothetical protein